MPVLSPSAKVIALDLARARAPSPARAGTRIVVATGHATLTGLIEAWRALQGRAAEPNPFAGPEVFLPALQHLDGGRDVTTVQVWRGDRLVGLFPLAPGGRLALGPTRLWRPPLLPPGPPLVDAALATEAIGDLLDWLALRTRPGWLELDGIGIDGSLARAVMDAAARSGRRVQAASPRSANNPTPAGAGASSPLAGLVPATTTCARELGEVRDAVEHFLVLQAGAAARSSAAALIHGAGTASFLRTATRHLARLGLCRVELVHVAGELAAAAIVVADDSASRPWLVALGERPAELSQDGIAGWIARDWADRPEVRSDTGDADPRNAGFRIAVRRSTPRVGAVRPHASAP